MGTSYNVEDFSMTDSVGIIPRAIVHLFDQIAASEDGDIAVEAQLIEVGNIYYGNKLYFSFITRSCVICSHPKKIL